MKRMPVVIEFITIVALASILTTTTNAYVTNNNNGNAATTTSTPSIMDWLPKNAFLPKRNLGEIQQQLVNTVFNLQLDMATTTTMTQSVDVVVPFTTMKKKEAVKSSHLLLQRSSDATPRLPIRNLQFELTGTSTKDRPVVGDGGADHGSAKTTTTATATKKEHLNHQKTIVGLPMPGYNGPHPLLSSGALPLTIQNCGEYVTLQKGAQSLPLSTTATSATAAMSATVQPQWEVIWKEQSPTGTIVCGIELQQSIRRNEQAVIPAGIMYLSFPIWDGAQLLEYQTKKVQYDITAKLYSQERDTEIAKMNQSNNVFNKLMHYRNAFAAAESYSLQPHKMYRNVPTSVSDLIAIPAHPSDNDDDDDTTGSATPPPPLYIVPKGMVRIVPTATMKQLTQTTPCGKVVMNRMLWSSSSTTTNHNNDEAIHDILHGTAKIVIPPPPSRPSNTATTSTTAPSHSISSTTTDTTTPFM